MALEGFNLFMIYFTSLVVVFNFACSLLVFRKYLIRKTPLIKTLTVLFFSYCAYMVFNIVEIWVVLTNPAVIVDGSSEIITFPMATSISSNPILITYCVFYTLDLVFATLTSIIAFKFKLLTFGRDAEKNSKFTSFVNGLGWVALVFSCSAIISINNVFMGLVGFFITLHLFLVYGSFTNIAFRTYNAMKANKEEKEYIQAFLFIALMPLSFILRNLGLFPISAVIPSYIVGYLGYVRPGQKVK